MRKGRRGCEWDELKLVGFFFRFCSMLVAATISCRRVHFIGENFVKVVSSLESIFTKQGIAYFRKTLPQIKFSHVKCIGKMFWEYKVSYTFLQILLFTGETHLLIPLDFWFVQYANLASKMFYFCVNKLKIERRKV